MAILSSAEEGAATAEWGSLDPEVARDVALLREFTNDRERIMRKLFGRTLRRSAARDEIIRLVVLAFAKGQILRLSSYVRLCAPYATGPSIRSEVELLVQLGLVLLLPDPAHKRANLLAPTKKLIDFYSREMPRLRDEVERLLLNQ